MIMFVNLTQIHRNLKSAAIWNLAEILCSQGFPLQIQIPAQSGRQSRNLAKTFCFQHFSPDLRFTEDSPHYMWAKPQGFFAAHVDVRSPTPITSPLTGENL